MVLSPSTIVKTSSGDDASSRAPAPVKSPLGPAGKKKDNSDVSTVSRPSKEKTEVQQEKLSTLQEFLRSSGTLVCPAGLFVVPKCPDNVSREIRRQHAFSNRYGSFYFIESEYVGSYFTLVQHLAVLAIKGEYDLKNIFDNVAVLSNSTDEIRSFTRFELALLYNDILSMYDYVSIEVEECEKVTRSEVDDSLKKLEAWNDFEFHGFVKDLDDFRKKKKYLYPLTIGHPDRLQIYFKWLKKQKTYLNSGDAKLSSVKESARRGEPGLMKVN